MAFTDDSFAYFASAYLPTCKLEMLNLSNNRIQSTDTALLLGNGLFECRTLRSLILKYMRLDSDSIQDLSKGFSYDLDSINLDNNKIGDSGIEKLADQFYRGEGNHSKDPWRTNT